MSQADTQPSTQLCAQDRPTDFIRMPCIRTGQVPDSDCSVGHKQAMPRFHHDGSSAVGLIAVFRLQKYAYPCFEEGLA
ncbi:uncharacterized protein ACIBXB_014492 isoform 2-T3 [Morphnus guianensis]